MIYYNYLKVKLMIYKMYSYSNGRTKFKEEAGGAIYNM